MKYIVVKALLGWGDRLESLKMCVDHAFNPYVNTVLQIKDTYTMQKESTGSTDTGN